MNKKSVYFTAIVSILLFNACSNESLLNERDKDIGTERTLSLTASLPDEDPSTRVDLIQDGKNILLTWVDADQIELVFVQGTTEIKQTTTVTSTSNAGKVAHFNVSIPSGITAGAFDLYGVYGGGGLSNVNPTHVILPENPSFALTLNTPYYSIQSRKDVVLYFASEGIETTDPEVSVVFKHLGSLFNVTVKNTGTEELFNLDFAALMAVNEETDWAYNSDTGKKSYDLVNKKFLDTENNVHWITFNAADETLVSEDSINFWGWYPPLPEVNWPELRLQLVDTDGDVICETVNTKPARIQPTLPGKTYHFNAEWNGSQLRFIESMTDPRDRNVYRIVTIGNQVWMAENLKYLPSVVGPLVGSETTRHYYVYDYYGTDVNEAKATENYSTYGVLYNWPAAMASSASSTANPSGVQGVCPTGWHLPSDAEWTVLANYDNEAGKKLKEAGTMHWKYPNDGATNETGFTALPGGSRYYGSIFYNIGYEGNWWSTSEYTATDVFARAMRYNYGNIITWTSPNKFYGLSIRCVKD